MTPRPSCPYHRHQQLGSAKKQLLRVACLPLLLLGLVATAAAVAATEASPLLAAI